MAKEFARQFYKSAAWQQARELALIRDHGLCQTPGCYMPAEEVHHIIELTPMNINDPKVALCQDNLTCLCRGCHMKIHRGNEPEKRYHFDNAGNLIIDDR
jgi:5-methylcytosine-specific restriction endonuclease McrA